MCAHESDVLELYSTSTLTVPAKLDMHDIHWLQAIQDHTWIALGPQVLHALLLTVLPKCFGANRGTLHIMLLQNHPFRMLLDFVAPFFKIASSCSAEFYPFTTFTTLQSFGLCSFRS